MNKKILIFKCCTTKLGVYIRITSFSGAALISSIVKNARLLFSGQQDKVYVKSGGFKQAKKDFYELQPKNVKNTYFKGVQVRTYHRNSDSGVIENFMLDLAEFEILNAHKYKNIKNSRCSGSLQHRVLLFLLINVQMPTIVGILTFMSRKIFMLS